LNQTKDHPPIGSPSIYDETVKYDHLFRLNRTIDYIQKHYAEDLDLDRLAGIACFSKYHFHRLFKLLTGETQNNFVRRLRLEKAVYKLILDKHRSITEIALDCGFSSSQNFSRAIRSYFGVTATFIRENFSWRPLLGNFEAAMNSRFPERRRKWIGKFSGHRPDISVRISEIPSCRAAYIRRVGPYRPEAVASSFSRLKRWAELKGIWERESVLIGTIWNNPRITPADRCICDSCLPIPEDVTTSEGFNIQTLPGGKYAIYHCDLGPQDFDEAWMRLIYGWLIYSDYQPDARPIYIYFHHSHQGGSPRAKPWSVDLCLAVRPL
jgi:AraC family transcriptional regulator